jgi:hypothetical protein
MTPIQLTISNNMLNISINVSDLLSAGSINISLNNNNNNNNNNINNNQIEQQVIKIPVANAEVIDDITNVTFRKPRPTKKIKKRHNLIIEDDEELEKEKEEPLMLCKAVSLEKNDMDISDNDESNNKKRKYISHKYERDADGLIQCPYCDCKKKNLSTISMHVSVNHASEMGRESNPFKCEHPGCNKRFPIKTRLQHHVNNHHVIENLDCPFPGCKYSDAKNKQTLYTHYVRKHMNYETMCNGNVCNTCNSTKPTGIIYHLATCNANSPFCKSIV